LKNRGIGLQKIFNILDKDGSGVLERDEFKKILINSDIIPGNMEEEQKVKVLHI
jgi:Ca2+-binding EF-hand superfamily protein